MPVFAAKGDCNAHIDTGALHLRPCRGGEDCPRGRVSGHCRRRRPERTTALVEDAARDAKCLISFGIAGGLSPASAGPVDVILSAEVIGDDRHWRPNERFHSKSAALAARIGAFEGAGARGPRDPRDRRRQNARLARNRRARGRSRKRYRRRAPPKRPASRSWSLRTIADPSYRELPPAALIPLSEAGTPDLARVLGSVLRRPAADRRR